MAKRQGDIRKYAMILEPEMTIASTRAGWLATHGYQAVLVRSVEGVIEKLSYLRPQLIFVGEQQSEPSAQSEVAQIFGLIRTVCPGAPRITIAGSTHADMTPVMFRQGIHHVPVSLPLASS